MSNPPSPGSHRAGSLIGSQTLPPEPEMRTDDIQLTPRSKVKALLAEFSSDSDDEPPASRKTRLPNASSAASKPAETVQTRDETKALDSSNASEDEGDEEEADIVRVPEGKTIARMWAANTENSPEAEASDEDAGDNVYARIKAQLGASKIHAPLEIQNVETARMDTTHTSSDEDEDLAPIPRRRKLAGAASPQTSPSARSNRSSPGLFVSPEKRMISRRKSSPLHGDDAEADKPTEPRNRLAALVARKREELGAKERETSPAHSLSESENEQESHKSKPKQKRRVVVHAESEGDDVEDAEVGKRLTQQARPTRKASKKALEEMSRETQRMSRNMQLTHEAKTKTKFTTDSFFKKFNFRQQPAIAEDKQHGEETTAAGSSSAPATSDAERMAGKDTPASSPPSAGGSVKQAVMAGETASELPVIGRSKNVEEAQIGHRSTTSGLSKLPNSKEKLMSVEPPTSPTSRLDRPSLKKFGKSAIRSTSNDSDDDLEIVGSKLSNRLAIFDNIPVSKQNESRSLHALRALADLNSKEKKGPRSKQGLLSAPELQMKLQRRAKEQAKLERDEKIQALRDKGVVVQTAEEKEYDQMQIENMLDKARKEADELRQREKQAAKKEGGEETHFMDTEDEDEDYEGSDEDNIAISGSEEDEIQSEAEDDEDEEDAAVEEEGEEETAEKANALVDGEAMEDDAEESESGSLQEDEEEANEDAEEGSEAEAPQSKERLAARRKRVVESEDEEDETPIQSETPALPRSESMLVPPQSSTADAFGFNIAKPAPLGLSQVFAGTMAEESTQDEDESQTFGLQSLGNFSSMPPPSMPNPDRMYPNPSESPVVEDSQPVESIGQNSFQESVPALLHFETQSQLPLDTQASQIPEPTQDMGFQLQETPVKATSVSDAMTDTQPLPGIEVQRSPIKKRNRLQRGRADASVPTSQPEEVESVEVVDGTLGNAFDVMRKASKAPLNAFDKEKSNAKNMVEEQAEESEDEYAGLGGASDDEDNGEIDEETRKIIDDEGNELVDEREIAAFYADKERADDEKLAERLYKDIANGGLRRKRGAEMDLWESDDEDEAVARRRAAKQREFAKMRKALLADEKIGKIAENPKQQAFLQAIEDREEEDDMDFLDVSEEISQVPDSQAGPDATQTDVLRPISANTGKRKSDEIDADKDSQNTRPSKRRANNVTKPTSLAAIRETLSEMIGESQSSYEAESLPTPSHSDEEGHESRPSPNSRRTAPTAGRRAVIDRMALKRGQSSSVSHDSSTSGRLAFQAGSKSSGANLRIPSLLRRATNGSFKEIASEAQMAKDRAAAGGKDAVRMGGSKKSSVNYYARESEKRAIVEIVEKERREGRERVGKMRRTGMGLRALAGGQFD